MSFKDNAGPCPRCGFDEQNYVPALHHLPPGTILAGKYLIGKALGEGGFGITYIGWDLNLEMKVAIKEYYPNGFVTRNCTYDKTVTLLTGQKGEFFRKGLDRFVDEARRLGKFWGLPGIVSVKDYFQENKTGYIVMEFAEGQTLKALLKSAPDSRLPVKQVLEMMRPVMKSLEKVHKAGLIHRDISPDNLMVNPSEDGELTVKLIDFGAARDYMAEGERSLSVMLKPGYAPEEQYRSRGNQGPWTDVYGLCATMYRAITGQVPEESLDRLEEDRLQRPSEFGVDITVSQEAALLKGLSIWKKDRFASMEALEEALYAGDGAADEPLQTPARDPGGEENVPEPEKAPKDDDGQKIQDLPAKRKLKKKNIYAAGIAAAALIFIAAGFVLFFTVGRGDSLTAAESIAAAESEMARKESAGTGMTGSESERMDDDTAADTEADEDTENRMTEVVWADSNMERLVREGLGQPEGEILPEQLQNVRVLRIHGNAVSILEDEEDDEGRLAASDDMDEGDYIRSLEDLKYFTGLSVLQISGHNLGDEAMIHIQALTGLTDLSIENNAVSSMDFVAELTNLTRLDVQRNEISEIDAAAALTQLTDINFSNNNVEDLTPLSGLTNLKLIGAAYNHITDITPLSSMTQLTNLRLDNESENRNCITDITPLEQLTKLQVLGLGGNDIEDIRPVAQLTALEQLSFEDCYYVSDLGPLAQLTSLTYLDLSGNTVSDLSPLAGLVHLQTLNLTTQNGNLENLGPLAGLTGLQRLYLGDNSISDLTPLSGLTNLQMLELVHTDVLDVSPLSGLTNLTYLSLGAISEDFGPQKFTNVAPLSTLVNLTDLRLYGNDITDITPLSTLVNLQQLYLLSNDISDISPLAGMTQLELLDLGGNPVSDIHVLGGLTNLKVLELNWTEVTDLTPLSGLTQLQELNVTGLDADTSCLADIEGLTVIDN